MGWSNPPIPWSEFERNLSDLSRPGSAPPVGADGGDSPAWSYKRKGYVPPADLALVGPAVVPYAELHAHSSFSFLDGASMPESLAEEAARLGLTALALTDHDGLYGIVRMAEAAASIGTTATIFGAELSLGLTGPQNGVPDPEGSHLLVLARKEEGYHRLAVAITRALTVELTVVGLDRRALVRDLTDVVASEHLRLDSLSTTTRRSEGTATTLLRIDIQGEADLSRVTQRLGKVPNVLMYDGHARMRQCTIGFRDICRSYPGRHWGI